MGKGTRHHAFNICQFVRNPRTGEILIDSIDALIDRLYRYKTLTKWALILHNKDTYIDADEVKHIERLKREYKKINDKTEDGLSQYIEDNQYVFVGERKPDHVHIVVYCDNAITVDMLAKWLGIPANQIDLPNQRRKGTKEEKDAMSFADCVRYLTHDDEEQQALGKYLYDDSEVIANFDWRGYLQDLDVKMAKYGRNLSVKNQYRYDVMYEGKTLAECQAEDPYNLMQDLTYLQKCRCYYLVNCAPLPSLRINIYIDGPGGIGKNTASRAVAKALCPDIDNPYYEVGGKNVSFDNYDGQQIVIWNDFRAVDLITRWGRGEVFDILDSHPTNSIHNIKYGKVKLINSINIINGIEPYEDFLLGLAGEYTDKEGNEYEAEDRSQSYRRVPIIMCLRETDYDVLLNQGVALGTREYEQYIGYHNIVGSFARVIQQLDGMAKEKVLIGMTQPVLDCVDRIRANDVNRYSKIEDIPTEFDDYGKMPPITDAKVTAKKEDSQIGLVQYQQNEIDKLRSENTELQAKLIEARSAARENIYKQATTTEKKEIQKQYFSRPA